jgi:hypothetical protein
MHAYNPDHLNLPAVFYHMSSCHLPHTSHATPFQLLWSARTLRPHMSPTRSARRDERPPAAPRGARPSWCATRGKCAFMCLCRWDFAGRLRCAGSLPCRTVHKQDAPPRDVSRGGSAICHHLSRRATRSAVLFEAVLQIEVLCHS